MEILLGLDLGTTNCKVVAIDAAGRLLASLSAPTPSAASAASAASGIIEYDARELWHTVAGLIRDVVAQLPGERVVSIAGASPSVASPSVASLSVASMGEAGVLIDQSGEPLVPILPWHDRRPLPWVDWWRERIPISELYQITGLPLDHTYSASKLLWLRQQYPQAFARAVTWLPLADWIGYQLTGNRLTSFSQASRSMLFDLRKRGWSVELCRLADLPPSLFPAALPSASAAGTLTAEAANVTGLPAGLPVVIGGHDHICAALAAGAVQPGIVLDSAGTAEVLLVTLDQPALAGSMASSGLCCGCHTARDRYYLMAGVHGGGTLGWVSRVLAGDDSPSAIASLMEEAAASPLGANGVRFVPYLSTSGPPERDPNSWGAWLGLHLQHTRADLARAVVEGVSFAIRYLLEVLVTGDQAGGVELRCVGGGTRNTFWQQVKADVIGAPIDAPATADFTALGAALLAGIGVGVFSGEADAIQRVYRSGVRYTPDPQRNSYYNAVYQREFPRLRSLYKQISIER